MPDPTDETRETEDDDAEVTSRADRMPTPEEERLAEQNELDPDAAASYEEAIERGANVKGEGRIE
ncbi:MAG: hypothetical protein JJE52_04025 [Acidimicrobiia bacterium]|nr:hypothetical protein [Acidimicrobiia bacterium]